MPTKTSKARKRRHAASGVPTPVAIAPPTQPQLQEVTIEQAVGLAHAHWDAGQVDQAERLCQQVLAAWPGQSDAHHLMGLMAHAYGNLDLAIEHVQKACQAPRTPALYLSNLAEMYRQKGLLAEAERAGRSAVKLDPAMGGGWNNLGIILQEAGKLEESRSCLERVVQLKPNDAEGHSNLGNTLKRLGRLDLARQRYELALGLSPNYAEAHSNLANLLTDLGRFDEALASARRAIEANPRLADAYINAAAVEAARNRYGETLRWIDALLAVLPMHAGGLMVRAVALKHLDRLGEALEAAEHGVSLAPDNSGNLNTLGEVLHALGRTDEALDQYDRASRAGGFAAEKAMVNHGLALMEQGDKPAARAAFERAIAAYPRSASALHTLSDMKQFSADDPDLARMSALLGPGGVEGLEDRTALHFGFSKALMDVGEADRSFEHLREGNRLKRASIDYNADATDGWMRSIAEQFPAEAWTRLAGGTDSSLPVFVLGMPRSGTTLVEQILASHPQVHGAGELSVFSRVIEPAGPYPESVAGLTPETVAAIGRSYLAEVEPLAGSKLRLVDKMPSNFMSAGLISLALPQARIIHVQRNPLDTCLSCYSKLFSKEQSFSYDLAELGRFYRAYERLMGHWRQVLPPDRFLEVRYEDVVAELEDQSRRMVAFLGLPWDDACLRFHETVRTVRTASVNQVRSPLFKTSIDRWKPYARHLGPLFEALGMPIPDLDLKHA